jgi:hypothetical protein
VASVFSPVEQAEFFGEYDSGARRHGAGDPRGGDFDGSQELSVLRCDHIVRARDANEVDISAAAPPPPPPPPPKPKCDPNYSGACVPIASDVDCAGGSGDGPAYVQGPVYVIGRDIYGP